MTPKPVRYMKYLVPVITLILYVITAITHQWLSSGIPTRPLLWLTIHICMLIVVLPCSYSLGLKWDREDDT